MITREWGTFENSVATVVDSEIKFGGKVLTPNRKLILLKASLAHSVPVVNSKRRAFTAKTLARSVASGVHQMFDFEHALEFYGAKQDRICGTICAAEARKTKGETAMDIVVALWRKAKGVDQAIAEMIADDNPWQTSMECEWNPKQTALAVLDDKGAIEEITVWNECSSELKDCVLPNTVKDFKGKKICMLMGGEDGEVIFTGGALTQFPADKKTELFQLAANDPKHAENSYGITFGWTSDRDWRQSRQEAASSVVQETASIIIGKTDPDPADGHTHEITTNLRILPTNGHTHWLDIIKFEDGTLEGLTSGGGKYDGNGRYVEHVHKVSLDGKGKAKSEAKNSEVTSVQLFEVESFSFDVAAMAKEIGRLEPAK